MPLCAQGAVAFDSNFRRYAASRQAGGNRLCLSALQYCCRRGQTAQQQAAASAMLPVPRKNVSYRSYNRPANGSAYAQADSYYCGNLTPKKRFLRVTQRLLQSTTARPLNITPCFAMAIASKLSAQPEGNGVGIQILIAQQGFKHQESLKAASKGRRDTRSDDEEIGVRCF